MDVTAFMDESGNTGSNLLDSSQPVFTFVGIGINNANLNSIKKEILFLKEKHNIRAELHGKAIFKRGKDKIIRDIAELLMAHHFQLFISIAEKRFVIASFVESDFFDPVFNDKCDNSWTYPLKERAENANFLFKNLSEEALIACGTFFSKGEAIQNAYKLILRDIKGKKYKLPLWEILQGAEPHLAELERITKQVLSDEKTIHAPNFFCYTGMINKIEHYYSHIAHRKCTLIFDSSREFNLAFLKALKTMQKAAPSTLLFPERRIPLLTGYTSILKFTAESSEDNLFIQCADLLASSINRVMCKIFVDGEDVKLSDAELFTLVLTFFHWKDFEDTFCDYVCSGELLFKMYRTLIKNQPKSK